MIKLKNIYKSFKSNNDTIDVLNDISFEINEGEICIIYGNSGVGKSTLLSIVGTLESPSAGDVFIDDELVDVLPDIYSVNLSYMSEDVLVDLSDVCSLKTYDWESSDYKIVFSDYDNPNVEIVDSAIINPFYYLGTRQNDRFFDSIRYDQHDLDFRAYFSWD